MSPKGSKIFVVSPWAEAPPNPLTESDLSQATGTLNYWSSESLPSDFPEFLWFLSLKLVVKKGWENADGLVKIVWPPEDPPCAWLSTWWEPTKEDYLWPEKKTRYRGGTYGIPQLASSLIPERSMVYARISWRYNERPALIQDLQERGFRFEIPTRARRRAGWKPEPVKKESWWRNIFSRQKNYGRVYAEVDRDFVSFVFKNYGAWRTDIWTFLVSRNPLADWAHQLDRRVVTKDILQRIDLFLCNGWEHGFEVLSSSLSYDQLVERAREGAENLKWQFETRT